MKIRKNILLLAVAVVFATALSSCNLYKKFELPQEGLTGEYATAVSQPVDSSALGNLPWQQIFTDPTLQSYINQALANNVDLKNAKLNVDIAQAQLQGAKLSYLPSITFAPNGSGSAVGDSGLKWGYQLPLAVSWEIDIFGRITNTKRQAESAELMSEYYRQATQSQIIGAVANTYYALVSLHNQLDIYNQTAGLWKESVQIMKDMKTAGRFTEVAVVQSQANYSSILAAIPSIELSIHKLNNTMSLLLNTPAREWQVNNSEIALPAYIANNGVPMSYLANRPDVRAAEQSLASAYYATNIARSAFYPTLTLSPTGGYGTLVGGAILDPAKWFVSLAGQLTAPIFQRGRIKASYKAAQLQQEQAMNNFQYTLLQAGNEVSEALVTIDKNKISLTNTIDQRDNLEKAVNYNKDLMALSNTTYLEVINAQQALLQAQIQVENMKLNINQAAINLYQTLGGGR